MSHLKKIAAAGMTLTMAATLFPMTSLADTKEGWVQNSEGKWSYYEDDAKVKCDSRFDESDYKYYVLDSKGYRYTKPGLYTASYFYTYYGDKVKFKRSFYVQSDGSLLRFSWKKIDGKWYYFDYDGMMEKGMVRSKEDTKTGEYKFYLLGSDGARTTKKGWHKIKTKLISTYGDSETETKYFYVLSDGTALHDCVKKIGGKYYAFRYDGSMVENSGYAVKGKKFYLYGSSGARVKITKKGWISLTLSGSYKTTVDSTKYKRKIRFYGNKDGTLATGWKKIDGKWYFFSESSGEMYKSMRITRYDSDGTSRTYIFNKKGVCLNH